MLFEDYAREKEREGLEELAEQQQHVFDHPRTEIVNRDTGCNKWVFRFDAPIESVDEKRSMSRLTHFLTRNRPTLCGKAGYQMVLIYEGLRSGNYERKPITFPVTEKVIDNILNAAKYKQVFDYLEAQHPGRLVYIEIACFESL